MIADTQRIGAIHFDKRSVERRSAAIEHERAIAVRDLLTLNHFSPVGQEPGPYEVHLGVPENRLILDIRKVGGAPVTIFGLSLTPFRRVVRDYSIVCESYYAAIGAKSLTQVEAIDMGRRAVHNEGAELVIQRLQGKVDIDHDTARLLFTLIYVLQTAGSSGAPASAAGPRVLFVCTRNAVRSPMAEQLLRRQGGAVHVASAGITADPIDPLAVATMAEVDIDLAQHRGRVLSDLSLSDFDIVVTLSREAASVLASPPQGVAVEHWEIAEPAGCDGSRDVQLESYRTIRQALEKLVSQRFPVWSGKTP